MLQGVAGCCRMLQGVAGHCSVLQAVAGSCKRQDFVFDLVILHCVLEGLYSDGLVQSHRIGLDQVYAQTD